MTDLTDALARSLAMLRDGWTAADLNRINRRAREAQERQMASKITVRFEGTRNVDFDEDSARNAAERVAADCSSGEVSDITDADIRAAIAADAIEIAEQEPNISASARHISDEHIAMVRSALAELEAE